MQSLNRMLMAVMLCSCAGSGPSRVQTTKVELDNPNAGMCWSECMRLRRNMNSAARNKTRKGAEDIAFDSTQRDREIADESPAPTATSVPDTLYTQEPSPVFEIETDGPTLRER